MAETSSIGFKSVSKDSCTTERDRVKVAYKWTLKEFLKLPQVNCKSLKSEQFPSAKGQIAYWYLKIYPRGQSKEDDGFLSLFLHLHSSVSSNIRAAYCLRLEDINGNTIGGPYTSFRTFPIAPSNCGYSQCIEREPLKLLLKESKSDTLIINCLIIIFLDFVNKPGPSLQSSVKIFHDNCLGNDFKSLLSNANYTDFVIKIDEREFKVHKNILHARSAVFAAMFNSNMQEGKSSEVTLEDVDPDVFEKVLQFIYTGSLATMDSDALDILPVADKYNIANLKEQCADVLAAGICSEKAVRTLILADAHHLDGLKAIAVEFISKNTEVVSKTDEWTLLVSKFPKLTTELLLSANRVANSKLVPAE